ncbi:unnamed protein product [Linum trigynum]|uniref:Glycosyltransferase n=1 Tax=Linum trigynum TaxID=586398 RepID=A0AAV2GL84_9ROSI
MDEEEEKLHILVFPFMAQGHVIPMIDTAKIFASRGLKVTVVTTPLNAPLFSKNLRRSFPSIAVETLEFPAAAAGLPPDCENFDVSMGFDAVTKFFVAAEMLQSPFENLLAETRPDCVLADWFFPWTTDSAAKFGIPRLVFRGTNFFASCLSELTRIHQPHKRVGSESDPFPVPGLPGPPVFLSIDQMPVIDRLLGGETFVGKVFERVAEAESKSYGTIHNTIYEFEPRYADLYMKELGRRAWSIGPVSLCNVGIEDRASRGKESSIDEHSCLRFLNSKKPRSVVYVCFGTLANFSDPQLKEIAAGLESSGREFVWVVRRETNRGGGGGGGDDSWLPAGFEERMEGKGLIIRGWAPQALILDHVAVGGFVTHCGWNSTLEGITAGLPMVTWPVTAEQFYNEKLLTEILGIGIAVVGVKVGSGAVADAVGRMMAEEGEEAAEMRRKAGELGRIARRAVEEGGSSYGNVSALIGELKRDLRRRGK